MSSKRTSIAVVSIICLISLTLYLAFSFPYSLFQLKQAENNELKSVIIVAQSGDYLPLSDPYSRRDFSSSTTYRPDLLGEQQLTNTGKERMFLLGKFLKLRYYATLLEGNPQRVSARSVNTDHATESTQVFLAGLNPAQDGWCWSATACTELAGWQPKAIHSPPAKYDDLLAPQDNCPQVSQDLKLKWKRSANYQQLLETYKSYLETLDTNIGLDLAKNLELMPLVENWLNTRKVVAGDEEDSQTKWYNDELAEQTANLTNSVLRSYLESGNEAQRIQTGRLLDEVMRKIDKRIELEIKRNPEPKELDKEMQPEDVVSINGSQPETNRSELSTNVSANLNASLEDSTQPTQLPNDFLEPPSVHIYMTDGQQLNALMNSLQIDSSQHTGLADLLLIELHRSSVTRSFYLRLFSISSTATEVFSEPIQVKTIACGNSADCSPDQLRQNIKPLMLDEATWSKLCGIDSSSESSTQVTSTESIPISDSMFSTTSTTTTTDSTTKTSEPLENSSPSISSSTIDNLDANLIVGPVHPVPLTISQDTNNSTGTSTSDPTQTNNLIESATKPIVPQPSEPATNTPVLIENQNSSNSNNKQSSTTVSPSSTSTVPSSQSLSPSGQVSVLLATIEDQNNQQELSTDSS